MNTFFKRFIAMSLVITLVFSTNTLSALANYDSNLYSVPIESNYVDAAREERIVHIFAAILKGLLSATASKVSATSAKVAIAGTSAASSGVKVQVEIFLRDQVKPMVSTMTSAAFDTSRTFTYPQVIEKIVLTFID